jgi:hypothetical protein
MYPFDYCAGLYLLQHCDPNERDSITRYVVKLSVEPDFAERKSLSLDAIGVDLTRLWSCETMILAFLSHREELSRFRIDVLHWCLQNQCAPGW